MLNCKGSLFLKIFGHVLTLILVILIWSFMLASKLFTLKMNQRTSSSKARNLFRGLFWTAAFLFLKFLSKQISYHLYNCYWIWRKIGAQLFLTNLRICVTKIFCHLFAKLLLKVSKIPKDQIELGLKQIWAYSCINTLPTSICVFRCIRKYQYVDIFYCFRKYISFNYKQNERIWL